MNKSQPLRVLQVLGQLNRAGAELRTLDLLRKLDRREFEMHFAILSGQPADLDREVMALGAPVHYCRLDWQFALRFRRLIRDCRIDVVHSHVHVSSGLILRCAARAEVPTRIAHFRSVGTGRQLTVRRRLQSLVMRCWLDRYATAILGNGDASLSQGWSSQWRLDPRCAVIHNGLDTSGFAVAPDPAGVRAEFGWPADCPLAIHVGRMHPDKNQRRLADIFRAISKREPATRFLLVGRPDPDIKNVLESRFRQWNMTDRVAMAGLRTDVPRLLKASNVMVFPSLREGLPGAVLEACAAGTPVVASDLPSIQEIASRLPGVRCLPLSAPDERWSEVAVATCCTACEQEACGRAVRESVYNIDWCVKAHQLVWAGATGFEIGRWYEQASDVARRPAA